MKIIFGSLTLLHSEWPKLYGVLTILSPKELIAHKKIMKMWKKSVTTAIAQM